jgi:hypothetical protein
MIRDIHVHAGLLCAMLALSSACGAAASTPAQPRTASASSPGASAPAATADEAAPIAPAPDVSVAPPAASATDPSSDASSPPASPLLLPPPAPLASPQVDGVERAGLARLLTRIAESDAALDAILALRAASVDAPEPLAPPVCTAGRALEALRTASATAPLVVGDVTALVRDVDELCARLRRWREPDERATPAIRQYLQQLRRIEGWMREIRGCAGATGPDAARCENAYGRTAAPEAAEAREVDVLLAAHRAELEGVEAGARPFPCATPTLARIATQRFVGTVARAQLPELPRAALRVCESIGVDEAGLRVQRRTIARGLDALESGIRARRTAWQGEAEIARIRLGE